VAGTNKIWHLVLKQKRGFAGRPWRKEILFSLKGSTALPTVTPFNIGIAKSGA